MARDNNLMRRGGAVYYARVYVPVDLVAAMGGKEQIWRSLRTADYAEAKRRKSAMVDQWHATFDDMRRRRDLTGADVATAVWDHYSAALDAGDRERASRPTTAEVDAAVDKGMAEAKASGASELGAIAMVNAMTDATVLANAPEWAARRRAARQKRLRSDLATGDTRLIEPDVDQFIARQGFQIERGGVQYRDLCHKLMRAEIEQLQRYAERDGGDYTGKPADPIVVEPTNRPEALHAAGETTMVQFAKYEKENPNEVRPETFKQIRRDVQHFADFIGPRVRAANIDKRHVREWKDLLADYPVKASETKVFKGLPLVEIVAANKALDEPKRTLDRHTVRRYMGNLRGFCSWMVKHDYLDANPVADMLPKKPSGPTTKRATFTDDQLSTLFTSPLFATCRGEEWRDVVKAGNVAVRDHRYWIPWIMLYSGARPGEIAQLHVADMRQEHGVWIMHITEEGGGGKRTKTDKGSVRVVPVHSELVRMGLIEHRNRMAAALQVQVFPEVEIPEEGQIAAQFSREFNRYLGKVGVKAGPEIVTYGLRHTFVDRARLADFMNDEIAIIVGHETGSSKKTVTSGYGNVQHGTLERRVKIVEAVKYPALAGGK